MVIVPALGRCGEEQAVLEELDQACCADGPGFELPAPEGFGEKWGQTKIGPVAGAEHGHRGELQTESSRPLRGGVVGCDQIKSRGRETTAGFKTRGQVWTSQPRAGGAPAGHFLRAHLRRERHRTLAHIFTSASSK